MEKRGREGGAAAVELALVLPLLMLLLWGIVEFGRGYNARIELTAAVREGARLAAVSTPTDGAAVTSAVQDAGRGLDPTKLSVSVTPCSDGYAAGDKATVSATYPFTYDVLFFGKGTVTLTATGVMRCGG